MTLLRRTRQLVLLLLLALIGMLVLGAVTPAAALAPAATGWWSTEQNDLVTLPGTAAAEKELVVAAAPNGPQAVAALHFDLPVGQRAVVLTLPIERTAGAAPSIGACAAEPGWTPAYPGPYADRPQALCDPEPIPASVDGDALLLNVAPLARGRSLDVLLLPLPRVGEVYDAFSVTFAPPGADALVLSPAPAPASSPVAPASPAPVEQPLPPAPAARAPAPALDPLLTAGGAAAALGSGQLPPPAAPPAAGATVPAPQLPVAAPPAAGARDLVPVVSAVDRAAALSAVVLLAVVLLLLSVIERRVLAAGRGDDVAGVGRFASRRTGVPRPL